MTDQRQLNSCRLDSPSKRQMNKIKHMYLKKSRYTFVWNLYARTWVLEYVDTWKSEEGYGFQDNDLLPDHHIFLSSPCPKLSVFSAPFPASVSWVPAWNLLSVPSRHWVGWPVVVVCLGLSRFWPWKSHETPQSQSHQAGSLSQHHVFFAYFFLLPTFYSSHCSVLCHLMICKWSRHALYNMLATSYMWLFKFKTK